MTKPAAKLDSHAAREQLQAFRFADLFIDDLGWNHPDKAKPLALDVDGTTWHSREIAQLSGFRVFEVAPASAETPFPDAKTQNVLWKQISAHAVENIVIFLDPVRARSVWLWMKREGKKTQPRRHHYIRGQPGDLFLSKLAALFVDLSELDEDGNFDITETANRVRAGLDVEAVTKQFFADFEQEHGRFLESIGGIPDDGDRRWYASVILNRLMFIWFLQKKFFLAGGNADYLPELLVGSRQSGKNRFFSHTLRDLFFEGFAKPEKKRTCIGSVALGDIPYLNGGLFLPHGIEARIEGDTLFSGPFAKIKIPDSAFEEVFNLFASYSWSLDDTPGGDDREINPGVLGYIFEKYINQKEFGAYYTRPEITEYLCEQTIHQLVLDAANRHARTVAMLYQHGVKKGAAPKTAFSDIADVLLEADGTTCRLLLQEDLPRLSLLDPACGSGAFLVAAMRTLLGITTALIGRCEAIGEKAVLQWIEGERKKHKAPMAYWVKKRIITDNLFGVDIMEEAVEIAKLRLFLALVASAETRDQLEPLPNIEFNLMPGNSLIGLLHVDAEGYDSHTKERRHEGGGEQGRMELVHEPGVGELGLTVVSKVAPSKHDAVGTYLAKQRGVKYEELLREKNRLVDLYKKMGDWSSTNQAAAEMKELTGLREQIESANRAAREILNQLLLKEFQGLGIQFEQATWDAKKGKEGKSTKRTLALADIEKLSPFHWAYEFDEIIVNRGGFDAIITNPPWDVFQTDEKEFSQKYESTVQKKKDRIEDWKKQFAKLMQDDEFRNAWLEYASSFGHVSKFLKNAPQYRNQISVIDGRQQASKLNLYKNFLEQTTRLLCEGGRCGIVIPSGIYTDLGAMQLRNMLFDNAQLAALHSFSNEREIFDKKAVHHGFKFCLLAYQKGGSTTEFTASFRINPREAIGPDTLGQFLSSPEQHVRLSVPLIKRLAPGSFSIMEFKSPLDIHIADKMLRYPKLSDEITDSWFVTFAQEFNMTTDSDLFRTEPGPGCLPLYEGKMIWQFEHAYAEPRYWVEEKEGRTRLLGRQRDIGQALNYQQYRLAHRRIASNTNIRTGVATVLPKSVICGDTAQTTRIKISGVVSLFMVSALNSFIIDWLLRIKVTSHCDQHIMYSLPIPRLTVKNPAFRPLVERAARLIGTAPEFDDLLKEVFGAKATHKTHGVTDPQSRLTLRAQIDALVARLYDLTETEFAHILTTFPLVDESVKTQTLNTYRDLLRLGQLPDTRV